MIKIDSQELNELSSKFTDILWEIEANLELVKVCIKHPEVIDEEKFKNTLKEHLTKTINIAKSSIDSL